MAPDGNHSSAPLLSRPRVERRGRTREPGWRSRSRVVRLALRASHEGARGVELGEVVTRDQRVIAQIRQRDEPKAAAFELGFQHVGNCREVERRQSSRGSVAREERAGRSANDRPGCDRGCSPPRECDRPCARRSAARRAADCDRSLRRGLRHIAVGLALSPERMEPFTLHDAGSSVPRATLIEPTPPALRSSCVVRNRWPARRTALFRAASPEGVRDCSSLLAHRRDHRNHRAPSRRREPASASSTTLCLYAHQRYRSCSLHEPRWFRASLRAARHQPDRRAARMVVLEIWVLLVGGPRAPAGSRRGWDWQDAAFRAAARRVGRSHQIPA